MDDEADACRVRNAALCRLLCDNGVDAPHIRRVDESEQSTLCRTRRPLPILIIPDKGKQLRLVRMIVDVANECTADCALRSLDVDAESGTAHKRDLLLGKPRLETVKIMTDRTVRHIQQPRKREELQRLVCHEQACRQHRAALCGRKLALRICSSGKTMAQCPQILRIAREHKARARAAQKRDTVGHKRHLDAVHLARHRACTDTDFGGDLLCGHIVCTCAKDGEN